MKVLNSVIRLAIVACFVATVVCNAASTTNAFYSTALQPDHKIVAGGFQEPCGERAAEICGLIARFTSDGHLDPSFGKAGLVHLSANPLYHVLSVKVLPNGNILAGGSVGRAANGEHGYWLGKFNSTGEPIRAFGTGGYVVRLYDGGSLSGLDVSAQGQIAVAAYSYSNTTERSSSYIDLFNFDGSPEMGFGNHGTIQHQYKKHHLTYTTSISFESDGRLIRTVESFDDKQSFQGSTLTRFTRAGKVDESFGVEGSLYFAEGIGAVALQADGKIVLESPQSFWNSPDTSAITVRRILSDGSTDHAFGQDGRQVVDFGQRHVWPGTLRVTNNGTLVGVGGTKEGNDSHPYAFRLTSSGALDLAFGVGGIVIDDSHYGADSPRGPSVEEDGQIIFSVPEWTGREPYEYFIVRLLKNGGRDNSFGNHGIAQP